MINLAKPDEKESGPHCESADVVLVNMPFTSLNRPSLAVGLLKSSLDPLGLDVHCLHYNLAFARTIGPSLYEEFSDNTLMAMDYRVGDWIFSDSLFENKSSDADAFFEEVLEPYLKSIRQEQKLNHSVEFSLNRVLEVRDTSRTFLENCLEEILNLNPSIVGFTSTFQQHVPALALAKKIKQHQPDVKTLIGGSNCEGIMGAETARQFTFLDAVVSGDGDDVFPEIVKRFMNGEKVSHLSGVFTPDTVEKVFDGGVPGAAMIQNMDDLPYPDFDEYFQQLRQHDLEEEIDPMLTLETSRGCWWGENSHCTFCGLNGKRMNYRSKSPDRALDELLTLEERHDWDSIHFVDNIIDLSYIKTLLPDLAEENLSQRLSYEVIPVMDRDMLRNLADAGFTYLLPGVDNLNSDVLSVMQRGNSRIQNVEFLKSCREFGIRPQWNILYGFPGETKEHYREIAEFIPDVFHLSPPNSGVKIDLPRFSPNFNEPEEHGFENIRPKTTYKHIYPLDDDVVFNLAYHFDYDYADHPPPEEYTREMKDRIAEWHDVYEQSDLFSVEAGDRVLIWDFRPSSEEFLCVLSGTTAYLYKQCETVQSLRELEDSLDDTEDHPDLSAEEIERNLESLVDHRFMVRENDEFVTAAVPVGAYTPDKPILEEFLKTIKQQGEQNEDGAYVLTLPKQPEREVQFFNVHREKETSPI